MDRYVVEKCLETSPDYKAIDQQCFRIKDTRTDDFLPEQYRDESEAERQASILNLRDT